MYLNMIILMLSDLQGDFLFNLNAKVEPRC